MMISILHSLIDDDGENVMYSLLNDKMMMIVVMMVAMMMIL